MKAINVTMAPVEQVTRTWTRTFPVKMDGEDGGIVNEYTYAGGWDELHAYAENFITSNASETCQVRASLRREAGGMAVLTLSTQVYLPAAGEEEEGGGEAGGEGEAEEVTEITYDVSGSTEDILLHPKFSDVKWDSDAGVALGKLARGAAMSELFEGENGLVSVGKAVQAVEGWEMVQRAGSFYVPHITATVSKPGASESMPTSFSIVTPSELKAPAGYNWLALGGSVQIVNGKKRTVCKYVLSGPSGWDKEIYNV